MKKFLVLVAATFTVAGVANAANVPSGLTGLWRFQTSADKLKATIGTDLTTSHPDNSAWFTGPWTPIGTDAQPGLYSDNGVVQERTYDYLTVYHGISPNGGGGYVNEYTVAIDYYQTQAGWNGLFQTSWNGTANDSDLWIAPDGTIGVGGGTEPGYSSLTFNSAAWHRIVWSVDNGSFFRVYVDGTLFLNGPGQAIDGRWSLELDRFHLFADNNGEDMWGLVGTAAVWDRALTSSEIAGMGGAATPLTLAVVPEPSTLSLLALGFLPLLRRIRR